MEAKQPIPSGVGVEVDGRFSPFATFLDDIREPMEKARTEKLELIQQMKKLVCIKKDHETPQVRPVTTRHKLSRNAPCPCFSGRKYKKCCGF